MKTLKTMISVLTTLFCINTNAVIILEAPATYWIPGTSNPKIETIQNVVSPNVLGHLLYKATPSGEDTTLPLVNSYNSTFTLIDLGHGNIVVGARINYDGGPYAKATYLLAKSGKDEGAYIWDIKNWNGKDQIVIGDVFNHAISHVEFFGVTSVPEPNTMLSGLFAAGIVGFSIFRKKVTNNKL